jgi:uncharacterized membrane protein
LRFARLRPILAPVTGPVPPGRIAALDVARTLALVAMAGFHFTVDLELFGFVASGTSRAGLFYYYARLTAGSFLALAGVSLWLAHGMGIRWRAFGRRLAMILAGAAAISLATWAAMPEEFVYFGILHAIAVASLAGLLFLRLPALVTLAAAALVLWLPQHYASAAFDRPWLWWTGLSDWWRGTMDFEPFFPWFAPFLAGLALAKLGARAGLWDRLRGRGGAVLWRLGWPGRHSLAVYLIHQPVLLGLVGGVSWLSG